MNTIIMSAVLVLGFQFPPMPEPTFPERPPVEAVFTTALEVEKPRKAQKSPERPMTCQAVDPKTLVSVSVADIQRFIFLDVDGVMAVLYRDHEYMEDGCAFECFAVRNLEAICDAFPDASIVISSTWRLGKTVEQLRSIFKNRGFKYPERIIDKTPRLFYADSRGDKHSCPRGLEVEHWLKSYLDYDEPRAYVIIDDDGDMMYWQRFNFVLTDTQQGLTVEKAKDAIEALGEEANARYQRMRKSAGR